MNYIKERESVCLNGLWDFCPGIGNDTEIPKTWDVTKIVVPSPWNINAFAASGEETVLGQPIYQRGGAFDFFPSYPASWEKADSGSYRTTFKVPGNWSERRITLKFNAVHFYSEYYINGEKAHTDIDGFLPVEFCINDFISFHDENELIVYVKKMDLFMVDVGKTEPLYKYEYPTGSFWGGHIAGIWQDVFLESYPEVSVTDIFVTTDVEQKNLKISTTLSSSFIEAGIRYELLDHNGKFIAELGTIIEIENKIPIFNYDYSGIGQITSWNPENPALYNIKATLLVKNTIVDIKYCRFGFRSFGIRNGKFILNGTPINLRNDSWHYMGFAYQTPEYARAWYKMARDANVNCIRLHAQVYPEFYLDIADEEGILIIDESSLWASHCKMHYSRKMFDNTKTHLERLVLRDRNHPSVIIWSVENEIIPAYLVTGDSAVQNEEELNKRIAGLGEFVYTLDETRPVSADGSGDLGGRFPIYSLHYPPKENPVKTHKPITIGEMGSMYFSTPDCVCKLNGYKTYLSFDERLNAIGRDSFEYIKEQRKWAAQVCIFNLVWYGLCPLPIKEHFPVYDSFNTPGIKPEKLGAGISTLNANFDANLPLYLPTPVFEWVKKAYIPERFFFEEYKNDYYTGDVFTKQITIFNDSEKEKTYRILWKFENDTFSGAHEESVVIPPADYRQLTYSLDLTKEIEEGGYLFNVEMTDGKELKFTDNLGISIKNIKHLLESASVFEKVVLVGANQETEQIFSGTGVQNFHGQIDEAENSLYILCDGAKQEIIDRLIMKKRNIFDISLTSKFFTQWQRAEKIEKMFLCVQDLLVTKIIEEEDLLWWKDGIVSNHTLSDYIHGNFKPFMVTGKGIPVISEIQMDGALYLLSGCEFLSSIGKSPKALKTLITCIEYCLHVDSKVRIAPILVTSANSTLAAMLTSLEIPFIRMDGSDLTRLRNLVKTPLLIADGSEKLDYLNSLTVKNVKQVFIFSLREENIPKLLKGRLHVQENGLNQLIRSSTDPILNGITEGDLYGLEPGNEILLTEYPLELIDAKSRGLLKNSSIDWASWNFQGEDRKTISTWYNENQLKMQLFGMASFRGNGMDIVVNQLSQNSANRKIKKLILLILSNIDVNIPIKTADDFDELLDEDVYIEKIHRILWVPVSKNEMNGKLHPALNRQYHDKYWKIGKVGDIIPSGTGFYGFYINSTSDLTDLLLNPDICGIRVESGCIKKLYLNGELIGSGNTIELKALRLTAGPNEIVIWSENMEEFPVILLNRKNNALLDLKINLNDPERRSIQNSKWKFDSSCNKEDCSKAVAGRGIEYNSLVKQFKGMYFTIDLGDVYQVTGIQFSGKSIKSDHIQWNTPRCFSISASTDGITYIPVYENAKEDQIMICDGKLIVHFDLADARFLKIEVNDVAGKIMAISELKVFSNLQS